MTIRPIRAPSRPLPAAYARARLSDRCPNCGAEPYAYCTRDDGHTRRLPCLARMDCQQAATGPYE